jgi:hypothetical protein
MILYQNQPPTTNASLYAVDRRITSYSIVAANLTNASATFRINHCVAGAAAADTNVVVPDVTVAAHEIFIVDLPVELVSGDVLRGVQGTDGAITVTIDGTDGT